VTYSKDRYCRVLGEESGRSFSKSVEAYGVEGGGLNDDQDGMMKFTGDAVDSV
jgi:hypothetical protein